MLIHVISFSRYLFNDAEVKPFDPGQIAAECFGGEMTVSYPNIHCDIMAYTVMLSPIAPSCTL